MIDRRSLLAGASVLVASSAAGHHLGATEHFDVPESVAREAASLPGSFRFGSRSGNVALIEFFDYNCPYCKASERDLDALINGDQRLRVLMINYPVLGEGSVLAAKVGLAVATQTPEQYRAFHGALFARRGAVDDSVALSAAKEAGVDEDLVLEMTNSDIVIAALRASAEFGQRNRLVATPSFVIGRQIVVGGLSLAQKRAAITAARSI